MSVQFCKWCLFLLVDSFIALTILFAHYEFPRHLGCLDYGTDQPVWLDVTPGSPNAIPLFFEMIYSPLPLPRDQNVAAIAGVVLRPDQPVILKGRPNAARFWSFVFYPRESKKHSKTLPSIDAYHVELERDGSYVVTFSPESGVREQGSGVSLPPDSCPRFFDPVNPRAITSGRAQPLAGSRSQERGAKNWVNTGDSAGGIIFMRTYLPEPGSPTRLPAIYFGDRLVTPEEEWHEPR
jgi:hypothetical protein